MRAVVALVGAEVVTMGEATATAQTEVEEMAAMVKVVAMVMEQLVLETLAWGAQLVEGKAASVAASWEMGSKV